MAEETVHPIIPITTPVRAFGDHEEFVSAVAVFPDRTRMVTGSGDNALRLWDMKDGVVLKKMEGHCRGVQAVAVSWDGSLIASGDFCGELIAWNGTSGESVTQALEAHSSSVCLLDFSPDGAVLATGSSDETTKLWSTGTWEVQGDPIPCVGRVSCIRYAPSGKHLAIATDFQIQICDSGTRTCIANFDGHTLSLANGIPRNTSLAWTHNSARLLSAGDMDDPTIREWDPSTGEQVGHPWTGHTSIINAIAVNSSGTLVASACGDNHVRLWRLSDRRTIAIFQHPNAVCCASFSTDGKHILAGGHDKKISEWEVPADALGDSQDEQKTDQNNAPNNSPGDKPCVDDSGEDYDYTDPSFFRGMHDYSHRPAPRPRTRPGLFKRLLAVINTPRPTATPVPPAALSSASAPTTFNTRLQHLLGSLRSTRPTNASQSTPLESRRLNFNLFPVGISRRIVDVAAARDEDRYGFVHETDAEAAAAMRKSGDEAVPLTQQGQPVPGAQGSQGRPTDAQGSSGGTGEVSYEVRCCGLFFSCGRPTSHHS